MNKKFMLLFSIPFIIYFLIFIYLLSNGLMINILYFSLALILLFLFNLLNYNKKCYQVIGFGALSIFTVWFVILGYFDFLKWTSSIVALVNLGYILTIYYFRRRFK